MQIPRLTLNGYTECRSIVVCVRCQFFPQSAYGGAEIVAFEYGVTQSLHRIPPLGDRIGSLFDRGSQPLFRFHWPVWQQLENSLESQQQTLEALQQCIVKLPRDPGALGDARLQGDFELMMQLPGRMVESLPQDGQLVVSTNIDLVAKIAARQRLCAGGQFGERDGDGPGYIPAQRSGCEQSQKAGNRDYYEKPLPHMFRVFVGSCPLLKYTFLRALDQRRTQVDQILDLSRQSELNSKQIARPREFDLTVNLRGQRCRQGLQGA